MKVVAGCTISWQSVDKDVDDGKPFDAIVEQKVGDDVYRVEIKPPNGQRPKKGQEKRKIVKMTMRQAFGQEECLRQKEAQQNQAGNLSTRMPTTKAESSGGRPSATIEVQVILAAGNVVSDESHRRVKMMMASSTNACWPSTMRSTMESTGVTPGYDKSRQVKMKYAAVKLIVLDSQNDYDNVGESTGVDMHAH